MGKIDKHEENIGKDVATAEKNIKKKNKNRGSIFSLLLGKGTSIMFTVIGGLILLTLIRAAAKKWKEAYMPKT